MTGKRLFVGRKTVEDRFTIINDYENEIGVKVIYLEELMK